MCADNRVIQLIQNKLLRSHLLKRIYTFIHSFIHSSIHSTHRLAYILICRRTIDTLWTELNRTMNWLTDHSRIRQSFTSEYWTCLVFRSWLNIDLLLIFCWKKVNNPCMSCSLYQNSFLITANCLSGGYKALNMTSKHWREQCKHEQLINIVINNARLNLI